MVPSSALGLLFFIVLLAPGLAYVLRFERSMPAPVHSAFRESLRVLFVSIVCLGITTGAASIVCWLAPQVRPDVQTFVADPGVYVRQNFASAAWWTIILVLTATALGFVAADPRLLELQARLRASGFAVALLGAARISEVSAWHKAMAEYAPDAGTGERDVFIGAQMDDGSYVRGYLVSYSPHSLEDGNRDLLLTCAEVIGEDGSFEVESSFTILSARNIKRLDVTHIVSDATAPGVPAQREPAQFVDTTVD